MTDQEPTQRYETPPVDTLPPSPIAPPVPPAGATDSEPAPVVTTRVAATPSARPGGSRLKWLVAVVVTVLVAGTAVGAAALLTGDSGNADVLAWTPADSVAYTELRLDLPGSQEAELAKVMSAFPGFDDQAAFPAKLNEALDQLVGKATRGTQSYQSDIQPWFSGQLAVSMGPLPATADATAARALLLAGTKDAAKAGDWAAAALKEAGATTSTDEYNGVTITTISPPSGASAGKDMRAAYATVGPVLAIGDPASVKAAIDTGGKTGLATDAQFKTASASISGDRLGFAYVDLAAIAKGATALAGDAASAMPKMPSALSDMAPPWTVAAIRAQDGAFIVDTRQPHVAALGPAKVAESTLPSVLPPDTVALAEGHDLGATLEQLKTLVAADPSLADGVKQIDDTLAIVGGFGAVVDWMGEAGIAVTRSGDSVTGGLLVTPTDRAAADRLLTQLRGFISLAGAGSGIKVSDETYGDATITTVDLSGLSGLATGGAVQVPADLKIAYAVTDQVVVLGYGTDFVKAVIDARSGPSLATSGRFTSALGHADKTHGSLVWVDVAGIRDLVESRIPAADRTDYQTNLKPYLDPLDSVLGTFSPGTDVDRGTFVVSVAGG
jgi:Protein of unknown function (DUF3352)